MPGFDPNKQFKHEDVRVFQYQSITDMARAEKAQSLAKKHGVSVSILAKSGESYTTQPKRDEFKRESEQQKPYTGTVPEGKVYMQITKYGHGDLSDFWKDMNAE